MEFGGVVGVDAGEPGNSKDSVAADLMWCDPDLEIVEVWHNVGGEFDAVERD